MTSTLNTRHCLNSAALQSRGVQKVTIFQDTIRNQNRNTSCETSTHTTKTTHICAKRKHQPTLARDKVHLRMGSGRKASNGSFASYVQRLQRRERENRKGSEGERAGTDSFDYGLRRAGLIYATRVHPTIASIGAENSRADGIFMCPSSSRRRVCLCERVCVDVWARDSTLPIQPPQ